MKNHTYKEKWPTFGEILQGLHREGIYIHSDQLAEFFLAHGLPVDLGYVPKRLKEKAKFINKNYQGDVATLSEDISERSEDYSQYM